MSKIKLVFFSMLMVLPAMMFAQTPLGINYQGIARSGDGSPLINQNIGLRVSITAGPDGSTDYIEEHHVITNDFGLFTVIVGEGQSGGSLNDVDWVVGNKWLQVEVDAQDQGNYTLVGTQQLVSVPYALFAAQSGDDLSPGVGIDISNGRVNNVLPDQVINLEGEGATTVSGTYPNFRINSTDNVEDADASPTNEIQSLTLDGNNLEISNGNVVDLSGFVNTDGQTLADVLAQGADANGAIITGLADPVAAQDAATKNYVDTQNDLDLDKDSTNEIQDLTLVTNTLSITNNSSSTPIDLSGYLNTDAQNLNDVLGQSNDAGTSSIINLGNPINPQDAATKDYVDTQIALDGDTDASNEIQTISKTGSLVTLSNGGGSFTDAVNDADASITNELNTAVSYEPNNTLRITDAGGNKDVSLGTLNANLNAGNNRVINLADPVASNDAVNLGYLEAKDATDYAFKSIVNATGTGIPLTFDLSSADFDEGSLIGTNQIIISEAGVYLFNIKGSSTNNAPIVINVNSAIDYPVGLINVNRYSDTILVKLNAGDIIELRANSTANGENFAIEFFGYKI